MERWRRQLKLVKIPYPQRVLLEDEMDHDLSSLPHKEFEFSKANLEDLKNIHTTWLYKMVHQTGRWKDHIEVLLAAMPLIFSIYFIFKEEKVIDFFIEGGLPGMYGIAAIGVFLLGREVLRFLRVVIIKDHSSRNIKPETSSVLLGCGALLLFGMACTLMGVYASVTYYEAHGGGIDVLLTGGKESITAFILCLFFCAFIVFAHVATRSIMSKWRVPLDQN